MCSLHSVTYTVCLTLWSHFLLTVIQTRDIYCKHLNTLLCWVTACCSRTKQSPSILTLYSWPCSGLKLTPTPAALHHRHYIQPFSHHLMWFLFEPDSLSWPRGTKFSYFKCFLLRASLAQLQDFHLPFPSGMKNIMTPSIKQNRKTIQIFLRMRKGPIYNFKLLCFSQQCTHIWVNVRQHY